MKRNLSKDEEEAAFRRKNRKDPNPDRRGKAINVATEETKKDHEVAMAQSQLSSIEKDVKSLKKKLGKKEKNLPAWMQAKITDTEHNMDAAAGYITKEAAGEKDACYHKVKSRYKVWPSAYASGALVKCRKKGAANWGNSTKKESVSIEDASGRTYVEFIDLIKPEPLQPTQGIGSELLGEKCWPGYEKKGMKTMFGKRYPNCVKKTKKEEVECMHNLKGEECPVHGKKECPSEEVTEAVRIPAKTGNLIFVMFNWRGKYLSLRMFFPNTKMPSRSEVQDQIEKVYPGARVQSFQVSSYEPGQSFLRISEEIEDQGAEDIRSYANDGEVSEGQIVDSERTLEEGAAWTKKSGKNPKGGLNEKGRKSYERENPGSDLKRPSKKVGNPRRKSFCARMKGMKKKLTSAKTANDPDSRINKSLRAWNC